MSKNADWKEQEFNAHLGFPPLPSSQMPTYGFGDDAEYFYDYQGPQSTPTNLPILRTDPSHLTYPPPSQPSADFAARRLAEMNKLYAELPERAASSSPFGPLREMAMNLPCGPIPSFHADSTTDDTRKLIGQSTAKLPTGSKSKRRSAGQEVVVAEPKAPARPVFAGPDLVQLARAVAHKQPFLSAHGEVSTAWKDVNKYLKSKGFQHEVKYTTLQKKAQALIAFKKDPKCEDAKPVASHITGDTAIIIAAALEQMEKQWDDAKDKSDDVKLKIKKKTEDDRFAGEEIRSASMRGRGQKRAATRSPSPSSDTDTVSPTAPNTAAMGRLSALSSIELDDTVSNDKKKSKRRRVMDRRTDTPVSASADLVRILEKDSAQRQEHQKAVEATMKAFTDDAKESRAAIAGFLEKLVEPDNKN
ncbi:hypothetical protein B0H10DRAFT_1953194 [Mycena sp. CBHHK59/15]|nr:hypothetical protein B0H10DRAFT_1953194 [Mycena sp. CBHHK59/15]